MDRFFRKAKIHFTWIDNQTFADIQLGGGDVRLNIVLMITEPLVHEYFHWRYPRATEARVRKMTYNRIKRMSRRAHLRLFFRILNRAGKE